MAVSGIDYSAIEVAIKQAFLTAFPERLFDEAVQIGDLDAAFEALMSKNIDEYTDALVIDFSGGTSRPRRVFANIKWAWITSGVYMIRYHEDVETALRTVVAKIPSRPSSSTRDEHLAMASTLVIPQLEN